MSNDCYKLMVNAGDGSCYKINTVFGEGCYVVNVDEGNITRKTILPPLPPKIKIPGFTNVKLIAANGQNEIIVIGKYKERETSPEREVIAKVEFVTSAFGGIGKFKDVYNMTDLVDIHTDLTYDRARYLESWDITKTDAKIAILFKIGNDSRTTWVDPFMFNVENTSDSSSAYTYPFYDEDSYGYWADYSLDWELGGCQPPFSDPTCDIMCYDGDQGTRCISSNSIDTRTYYNGVAQGSGEGIYTIGGYNQSDDTKTEGSGGRIGWFQNGGTPIVYEFLGRNVRGNFTVTNAHKVLFGKSWENIPTYIGCMNDLVEGINPCDSYGHSEIWYRYPYGFSYLKKDEHDSAPTLQTATYVMTCSDGTFAATLNDDIKYVNIDGTISGSASAGTGFTLYEGILIVADGSDELTQHILDPEDQ